MARARASWQGLINPSQTWTRECGCGPRGAPLSPLKVLGSHNQASPSSPTQGSPSAVGRHLPAHAAEPCGLCPPCPPRSRSPAGAFTSHPSASPPSLAVLASQELPFLYLILHLTPHFSFCCPHSFSPPGFLPNNPPPIPFPSSIPALLHLCLNTAFPGQYRPKAARPAELPPAGPCRIPDSLPPLQFAPVIAHSRYKLPGLTWD